MAIVLTNPLRDASEAASAPPFVQVTVVTTEGVSPTVQTFNTNGKVVMVRKLEEVWGGDAEIWLDNSDLSLSNDDFRGRRVRIYFGYDTSGHSGSGVESVERAPVWVVNQRSISFQGKIYLVLHCWDSWNIMASKSSGGDASGTLSPSYNMAGNWNWDIEEIVEDLLSKVKLAGFTSSGIGLSTQSGDLDVDGLGPGGGSPNIFSTGVFKEYSPSYIVEWGTPVRDMIRRLMDFTKVQLYMDKDGMKAIFPQSGDTDNWEYDIGGDSTDYPFIMKELSTGTPIPNRIIYADIKPSADGTVNAATMTATSNASEQNIGIITALITPQAGAEIGQNSTVVSGANDAKIRADNIIANIEFEAHTGKMRIKLNPGHELIDKINVIDTRDGITTNARTSGLEFIWDSRDGQAKYETTIAFGGTANVFDESIVQTHRQLTLLNRQHDMQDYPASSGGGDPTGRHGVGTWGSTFYGYQLLSDRIAFVSSGSGNTGLFFTRGGDVSDVVGAIYADSSEEAMFFVSSDDDNLNAWVFRDDGGDGGVVSPLTSNWDLGGGTLSGGSPTLANWDNIYASTIHATSVFRAGNGSVSVASYGFINDTNSGMYHHVSTADLWYLVANGKSVVSIGGGSAGSLGFFTTAPIAKQTSVAVSSVGIHAALVNLGLIT